MGATMKDVARVAGVSPSTVCRVLTNPDIVRPETRERVRRAANELGYDPNRTAGGLITGRTGHVGLVVPDLTDPFFPALVKAVQARAHEWNYQVFLADTDGDPAAEADLVRVLTKRVDGIVLCSPRMADEELRAVASDTPIVVLNRRVARVPSVSADSGAGVRQVVAHLTALGHRRMGYVAGPRTSWSNRERVRSLRAATAQAGMDLVEVGPVTPHFDGGVAAVDLVLAANVTAVLAYNDLVALGLLNQLDARGLSVPGDISVIGFDDIAPAAMVSPALTTVCQPREPIGRTGMDLLLRLLRNRVQDGGTRRELVTKLVVRDSTGPASSVPPDTL
jgi:LacI family transcriptional regulator